MLTAEKLRERFGGARQLAGASGLLVAGRIAGAGANFAFAVILARALSPADVGAAFAAISAAFLASVLVTLNIESGSIRFLVAAREAKDEPAAAGFIFFGRMALFCATPVVAGAFIAAALLNGEAERLVMILAAAASIPAIGWMRLSGSHATALGSPVRGSLPRTALQPALLIGFFAAAMMAGAPASAGLALICFLASFLAAAAAQFALLRRHIDTPPAVERRVTDWRNWTLNGFYMSPMMLLQDYLQHAIVLAAAVTLPAADVAVLAVALRFISLIRFGVLSVNMAASPMIARAIAGGDHARRDERLRSAALLKAPAALVASAAVIVFSGPILTLFGPEYAGKGGVLACFTLIPLIAAVLGPNHMLLNISGKRSVVFAISLVALAALFVAVPVSAALFGVAGAAAAATLAYGFWETALYAAVRLRLGMDASILAAFKTAQP